MTLPVEYQWLEKIGTLPKLVAAALQYLGVKETPGLANNPVIMDMAQGLGVSDLYTSDSLQAWCAVFENHLIRITGKPIDLNPKDRYDLLRARKVASLFNDVPVNEWVLGDTIILKRTGGGHTFTAICENRKKQIIGIGGNQSNMVCFAPFDQKRIIAVKRFYSTAMPASAKRYRMDISGEGVSEV